MARSHIRYTVRVDQAGSALVNAKVFFYVKGTTTALTDVYDAETGGNAITFDVTNTQGEVEAWKDVPAEITLSVTDNNHTAYLAGDVGVLRTFGTFTEDIDVFPPAIEIAEKPATTDALLYVSTNGLDTNDGLSWGSAKRTLQAAVNALDSGTVIAGHIRFRGNHAITSSLTLGDGTKFVNIVLEGSPQWWGSAGPISNNAPRITSSGGIDAVVLNAPTDKSHSFVLKGFQVIGSGAGSGIKTAIGQMNGLEMEDIIVSGAGIGLNLDTLAVYPSLKNVTTISCTTGIRFGGGMNAGNFQSVVCQLGTTGWSVEGAVRGTTFDAVTIQSTAGAGINIAAGGYIEHCEFGTLWFEFPGSDMIRLSGGSAGRSLEAVVFNGCLFDGSSGAGGRNVINNVAAAGSSVNGRNIKFAACSFFNLNGGKITNIATDPTNSSDPGYVNINIDSCEGVNAADMLKGIHTATSVARQLSVIHSYINLADPTTVIQTSSVYSVKPRFVILDGAVSAFRGILKVDERMWVGANDSSTNPDASSGPRVIVGDGTSTGTGYLNLVSKQTNTAAALASISGANYEISAAEKRIAYLRFVLNGAINTGQVDLTLAQAGVFNTLATFKGSDLSVQLGLAAGRHGFYGATPVVKPTAYTQTYATADKTLAAYTSDTESAAYTGAADGEAKLVDINALRVAYENLRVHHEELAQFVNSLVDDMQALGLIG